MNTISDNEKTKLMNALKTRFEENMERHENIKWKSIETKLRDNPKKLISLSKMEATGGEPDVVDFDEKNDAYVFFDCSKESPTGRRSLCYDKKALDSRKKFKPENSAVEMAFEMGIELLTEVEYQHLQTLGEFDLKTSSWLKTPVDVRKLGGAIFGDRRYNRVFVYHNGADSYYSVRGFRGSLKL